MSILGFNRRAFLATIVIGGVAALTYRSIKRTSTTSTYEPLEPSSVTFGEWELLALDSRNAEVLVIDPTTETLLARLAVGGSPSGILQSGNGMAVAVDAKFRRMTVFRRRETVERLVIDLDIEPTLVALSPTGALFSVLDKATGDIAFISTEDGRLLSSQKTFDGADNLMFDQFGSVLYVTGTKSDIIAPIDAAQFRALEHIVIPSVNGLELLISTGNEDQAIAVSASSNAQMLHVVDLQYGEVDQSISLPTPVSELVLDPRGIWLFAASRTRAEIYRHSLYGEHLAILEADDVPGRLILGRTGQLLGAVNAEGRSLSFFDTRSNSLIGRHQLPSPTVAMAHHSWSQKTVLALENKEMLWVMDRDDQVRHIMLEGAAPSLIAVAGFGICHA